MREGPFTLLELDKFMKKNAHQFTTQFTKQENDNIAYSSLNKED